jgi:hypothetical protein
MDILEEIIEKLKDNGKTLDDIKCLTIRRCEPTFVEEDGNIQEYQIPIDAPEELISSVLHDMSQCYYDSGYGGQELFGIIWLKGKDWLEREEYDGSEWWTYKTRPTIPDFLQISEADL